MPKITKLATKLLRKSSGQKVKNGDTLLVWYDGILTNGDRFDANYDFNTFAIPTPSPSYFQSNQGFIVEPRPFSPFEFVIGAGNVIKGWDEAFSSGRRVGEVIELQIPWKLAYGKDGAGSIPPKSDLTFTIEVLGGLPENETVPNFPTLEDIGINAKNIGLNTSDLSNIQSSKIGLDGRDRMIGDNTNDLLIGLAGNDRFMGAAGADRLIGGSGNNRFIYTDINDSPNLEGERDMIFGFQSKKDKFNFRALEAKQTYIGAKKFSGSAGEIRFKDKTLMIDVNGDQSADLSIELPGVKSLSDTNFLL
jgi:Ca2+-binding RTX toxin-like protein